jgi:DnaJ-class molecular chaperone
MKYNSVKRICTDCNGTGIYIDTTESDYPGQPPRGEKCGACEGRGFIVVKIADN